jgi:hypothetical protein
VTKWKTENPGEAIGKTEYLKILDEAIERARTGNKPAAFKYRGETVTEFRARLAAERKARA